MKKTIEITDPDDYRFGDHFTGTYTNREGTVITASGKIQRDTFTTRSRLFVVASMPYLDAADWRDVTVTREVDEPSNKEIWDSIPAGGFFRFNDAERRHVKVSPTSYFHQWSDGSYDLFEDALSMFEEYTIIPEEQK